MKKLISISLILISTSCFAYYSETLINRIFRQAQQRAIVNTTTETSLFIDTGATGSRTIPANYFRAGKTVHILARGSLSTGSAQDATLRSYFGSVILGSNTVTLPNSLSNSYTELDMDIVCRSTGTSGTLLVAGRTMIGTSGLSQITARTFTGVPITVNTTLPQAIDFTYQFANALPANALYSEIAVIDER